MMETEDKAAETHGTYTDEEESRCRKCRPGTKQQMHPHSEIAQTEKGWKGADIHVCEESLDRLINRPSGLEYFAVS